MQMMPFMNCKIPESRFKPMYSMVNNLSFHHMSFTSLSFLYQFCLMLCTLCLTSGTSSCSKNDSGWGVWTKEWCCSSCIRGTWKGKLDFSNWFTLLSAYLLYTMIEIPDFSSLYCIVEGLCMSFSNYKFYWLIENVLWESYVTRAYILS